MSLENLLLSIVLLPFLSSIIAYLLRKQPNIRETTSILFACINLLLAIFAYSMFLQGESANLKFIVIDEVIFLGFYTEKISMMFAIMVNFLWIISIIYSMGYLRAHHEKKQGRFFAFLLYQLDVH